VRVNFAIAMIFVALSLISRVAWAQVGTVLHGSGTVDPIDLSGSQLNISSAPPGNVNIFANDVGVGKGLIDSNGNISLIFSEQKYSTIPRMGLGGVLKLVWVDKGAKIDDWKIVVGPGQTQPRRAILFHDGTFGGGWPAGFDQQPWVVRANGKPWKLNAVGDLKASINDLLIVNGDAAVACQVGGDVCTSLEITSKPGLPSWIGDEKLRVSPRWLMKPGGWTLPTGVNVTISYGTKSCSGSGPTFPVGCLFDDIDVLDTSKSITASWSGLVAPLSLAFDSFEADSWTLTGGAISPPPAAGDLVYVPPSVAAQINVKQGWQDYASDAHLQSIIGATNKFGIRFFRPVVGSAGVLRSYSSASTNYPDIKLSGSISSSQLVSEAVRLTHADLIAATPYRLVISQGGVLIRACAVTSSIDRSVLVTRAGCPALFRLQPEMKVELFRLDDKLVGASTFAMTCTGLVDVTWTGRLLGRAGQELDLFTSAHGWERSKVAPDGRVESLATGDPVLSAAGWVEGAASARVVAVENGRPSCQSVRLTHDPTELVNGASWSRWWGDDAKITVDDALNWSSLFAPFPVGFSAEDVYGRTCTSINGRLPSDCPLLPSLGPDSTVTVTWSGGTSKVSLAPAVHQGNWRRDDTLDGANIWRGPGRRWEPLTGYDTDHGWSPDHPVRVAHNGVDWEYSPPPWKLEQDDDLPQPTLVPQVPDWCWVDDERIRTGVKLICFDLTREDPRTYQKITWPVIQYRFRRPLWDVKEPFRQLLAATNMPMLAVVRSAETFSLSVTGDIFVDDNPIDVRFEGSSSLGGANSVTPAPAAAGTGSGGKQQVQLDSVEVNQEFPIIHYRWLAPRSHGTGNVVAQITGKEPVRAEQVVVRQHLGAIRLGVGSSVTLLPGAGTWGEGTVGGGRYLQREDAPIAAELLVSYAAFFAPRSFVRAAGDGWISRAAALRNVGWSVAVSALSISGSGEVKPFPSFYTGPELEFGRDFSVGLLVGARRTSSLRPGWQAGDTLPPGVSLADVQRDTYTPAVGISLNFSPAFFRISAAGATRTFGNRP
jgi:hypothetical protein